MPAIVPFTPEQRIGRVVRGAVSAAGALSGARETAQYFRRAVERSIDYRNRVLGRPLNPIDRKLGGAFKPVAARRLNMDSVSRMGQFVAGATNVVQRGYKRIVSGKKPKRNAKLALKFLKASQSSCIVRYQRLGRYETFSASSLFLGPGSLPLAQIAETETIAGDNRFFDVMPVQIFDLTSMRYKRGDGFDITAPCQFQLCKLTSGGGALAGTVGSYFWRSYPGQDNAGNSLGPPTHWDFERSDSTTIIPPAGGNQYLDWVDIRLCLFGAKAQTTRFTVSLVQFTDRAYDPLITYNRTTPINDMRTVEEQRNMDAAYDQFCQPLVYHPMSSAGATKISPFKVLMKKTYVIAPDSSVNLDNGQPNLCVKFFKRMNRMLNYNWDDNPVDRTGEGLDDAVYNKYTAVANKPTVHPRAKVFLMVTAQSFFRQDNLEEVNANNTPTMDCIIRKKHVFDRA